MIEVIGRPANSLASLSLASITEDQTYKAPQSTLPATPPTKLASAQHPKIIFILTDDLAMNLVQYMHHSTSQADPTE